MGFKLNGALVFHPAALTLFDQIIPGGSRFRLPVPDKGGSLPGGFWLPVPWMIEYDQGLESNDWFSPHDDSAWREQLGLPDQDAPGTGFDLDDFRFGSLLSLAGPPGVMLLEDSSFAGTLSCEHAATFVQGRLVKAAGLDYRQSLQYRLEGRAWILGPAGNPTSDCAAVLHPALGDYNLYDADYLPRDGMSGSYRPLPPAQTVLREGDSADWGAWFPAIRSRESS